MTMPHLMNCMHSETGWCLECVGKMHDELEIYRKALKIIEKWGIPPTGKFHENGTPKSYDYCYGSNGEKDYIRSVASEAVDL